MNSIGQCKVVTFKKSDLLEKKQLFLHRTMVNLHFNLFTSRTIKFVKFKKERLKFNVRLKARVDKISVNTADFYLD